MNSVSYTHLLNAAAAELQARIDNIIEECELFRLYDPKKKLFSIGWDAQENKLSGHYYDLLASESRLCS